MFARQSFGFVPRAGKEKLASIAATSPDTERNTIITVAGNWNSGKRWTFPRRNNISFRRCNSLRPTGAVALSWFSWREVRKKGIKIRGEREGKREGEREREV